MDDNQALAEGGFPQAERLLAIDTPLGPDEMLLTSLEGEDALSRCFVYRITVATQQTDGAMQSLLGMPVTLWLQNDDPGLRRPIHGHVCRVAGNGVTDLGLRIYRLEVVPRLWFLTCTSDCRIFQNQSIPDILQTMFQEQGLIDFEFRVMRADYPPVEYCVQYQETAFNFVSRLMEHLGLFYWHEHGANRHLLVIADRNEATAACQPATVTLSPASGIGEVQCLEFDCSFRPGRWTLNDYDFQSPTRLLNVAAPTTLDVPQMASHEMYEFPGKFLDQETGRWLSRRRIEFEEARQHVVSGTGRAPGFDPGRHFGVSLTRTGRETSFLLTEVRHHATDPIPEPGAGSTAYSNDFVAIPAQTPFRPERLTPKPYARGQQTATVVGPAGESIWCDSFGRVKVQFHWDRRGQRNDNSSCWMRVSQPRAGSYYGHHVIPHVGHEVIVSFLEGDPDRPVITGTVPNALTMPPMLLPLDKDKTIQRDHGDNRIVMQGKAGGEHLSMVSPRAVNLVSSGPAARTLSSASVPPQNLAGGEAGGSGGGFGSPFMDDGNQDTEGWASLSSFWGSVSSSSLSNDDLSTGRSSSDTSDVNLIAADRIQTLSLGDTNQWVGRTAHQWVRANRYDVIQGMVSTLIGDQNTITDPSSPLSKLKGSIEADSSSAPGEPYYSLASDDGSSGTSYAAYNSIAGNAFTQILWDNTTFVGGDRNDATQGSVNLVTSGDWNQVIHGVSNIQILGDRSNYNHSSSATTNIGASATFNLAASVSFTTGASAAFFIGPNFAQGNVNIQATGVYMGETGFDFSYDGAKFEDFGINVRSGLACIFM
jgi:type VI secretion system secreted protein VgrG